MPLRNGGNETVDGGAGAAIDCPGLFSHQIISVKIMSLKIGGSTILSLLLTILLFSNAAVASSYQYIRLGNKADSTASPVAGTAMMGGGKDLDEAFRWLCKKASGGDFLVLRARGDDDYNSYVKGMCKLSPMAA